MLVVADRVKQTSITQGSGNIIFNSTFGAFQSFSDGIGDGNSTYYVIENNSNFEVGIGTYTESTNSLSRDTILVSSNNNAHIDLLGVSLIFCTYPASKALFNDDYRLSDNRNPNPHTHPISGIVNLQSQLDNKQPSGSYAASVHSHYSTDILDFATAVSSVAPPTTDASLLTTGILSDNRLSTNVVFTNDNRLSDARNPLSHNHIISEVSGLQIALDGIQLSGNYASYSHGHGITEVSGLQTALDGKQPSGNYANSSHSHTSSAITDFNSSVSGLVSGIYAPLSSPTLTGVPLTPTASSGTNTNQIASTSFVRTEISNLVASAPSTLDTLNELAIALGNDPNFATTITNNIAGKAALSGATFTGYVTIPSGNINATNIGITTQASGNFSSLQVNGTNVSVSGHGHNISEISNLQTTLDGKQPSGNYAALSHTHSISNVSGLQTALDGKQPSGNYANSNHSHTSSAITDFDISVSGLVSGIYAPLSGATFTGPISSPSGFFTFLQFPDNLTINDSIISNLNIINDGELLLSSGSKIEVDVAKTVISNETTNSLGGGSELSAGSLVEISDGKVVMANQTINSLDGGSSSLTGRKQIEVNSSGILIGNKAINTLDGNSISAFDGWTFDTADNNLILPRGGTLNETNNTVALTPPTAVSGQSLVIRPTLASWILNSSGYIVYGSPITISVTLQSWDYFGTVNYTISGSGVTQQSLGRALTGKLTFVSTSAPDTETITWTIPANSNITEFTLTLTSVDGTESTDPEIENDPALYYNFEENGMPTNQFVTVTNSGISNSEHSHIHLVAGDPSTVDIYLGDDDQYVKIEKNGGDVIIGTDSNNNHWIFDTNGNLITPTNSIISKGYPGQTQDGSSWFVSPSGSFGGLASTDGEQYIQISDNNEIYIGVGWPDNNAMEWIFNRNGTLTLPATSGNIKFPDNTTLNSANHDHSISNVSGLQTALDSKQPSGNYANSSHNHNIADVSGLQTVLDGKQPSGNYANASHTHTSSSITDFNSAVSGLIPVKDITSGYDISITNTSGIYSIASTNLVHVDSKQPQGFVNRTDSRISVSGNIFTIQPTGSSYSYYNQGIKVVKTSGDSLTIPNLTQINYIHFDTINNQISNKTTSFDFSSDIPIAYVAWNSGVGPSGQMTFFAEERHGIVMDTSTHKWIHNTFGMQYVDGLSIGNYVLGGNGSSNTHATISIGNGTLYQEDIQINVTDSSSTDPFCQELSPIAQIPVYYHEGSTGQWVKNTATDYPVKYGANGPQYNLLTDGTWTIPDVSPGGATRYFAVWILATNQIDDPIISIMGQRVDSNQGSAESHNSWGDVNLTNLPLSEVKPLYRLIFAGDSDYTNVPKCTLLSILDIRVSVISTIAGVTQNDHGNLFGLGDDDHSQYIHIDNARTISAVHTFSNGLTSNGLISSNSGNFTQSLQVNGTGVSISGHTHTASQISDSTTAGRALLTGADASAQRTSLGLGSIATLSSGTYATISHTHTSSNITDFSSSVSGLIPVNNIVAGTNIGVTSTSGTYTINNSKTIQKFTPRDNHPPSSNFATLDTRNSILVLDFDAATEESSYFVGIVDEAATLTNGLVVRIWWMADAATSGNVRWGVQFEKYGTDLDADSFDTNAQVTSAANGTSGIESVAEITITTIDSLAAGDRFRLRVYRVAADATNDTMTGDAQLTAIEVRAT